MSLTAARTPRLDGSRQEPVATKKSNLERYNKLQDLVKKKTQVKLQLTTQEKELLRYTWGNKEQSERSISYMMTSSAFWERVNESLRSLPDVNLSSLRHLTHELPGILQMAILNLDTLSNLDEYLANLGRRHRRIFGTESHQFYHLGNAMIDTMLLMDSAKLELQEINAILDVWTKLYTYLANSIIQAYLNDPKILNNFDDPFEITNIDVDAIIEVHFPSTTSAAIAAAAAAEAQAESEAANVEVSSSSSGSSGLTLSQVPTNEALSTQLTKTSGAAQQDETATLVNVDVNRRSEDAKVEGNEASNDNDNDNDDRDLDDDDDTDVYDIFRASAATSKNKIVSSITSSLASTQARSRASLSSVKHQSIHLNPVSAKSYAQLQRRPTYNSSDNAAQQRNASSSSSSSTKKMGFFKRMAVKAT